MEAEPLVLAPGLACTGRLFAAQSEAWPGPVQVADHGRDDTMAAIARRLLAEAPPHFALAGLSMGGYVALEVMRQAPERVTRLALLDTSARADTPEQTENRRRLIALAEAGRYAEIHPILWPKLVHPRRVGDAGLEAVVRGMAEATGPGMFVRQQRAIMGRADSRPLLPSIRIPVLVLVGADDGLTPPDLAREMAEAIGQARLVVVPDCGHLSSLEAPEAVTAALRAWGRA